MHLQEFPGPAPGGGGQQPGKNFLGSGVQNGVILGLHPAGLLIALNKC